MGNQPSLRRIYIMSYTKKTFEEKIAELYPKESISIIDFKGVKKPCTCRCNVCSADYTLASAEGFIKKNKKFICSKCHPYRKYSKEDYQKKIGSEIMLLNFTSPIAPVTYQCNYCHRIFKLSQARYLFNRKILCPCRFDLDEEKKKLLSYKLNNSFLYPIENTKLLSQRILWKCKNCGFETRRTISEFLNKTDKCPCCQSKNIKKTNQQIDEEIQSLYGNEWLRIDDYVDSLTSIKFKHQCGFIRKISPHQLLSNSKKGFCSCPKCSKKESLGEKKIRLYLEANNIIYEEQKPIKTNNHTFRADFFLPEYNLYIEFQGEQHFKPIDFFGGEDYLEKIKYNDLLKKEIIERNGSKLLYILYIDINNINSILRDSTTISKESTSK